MKRAKAICFVAGKSGGHIIPALTKAHQIIRANPHYKILFFSTNSPLDQQIIAPETIIHQHVSLTVPHKRYSLLQLPRALIQFGNSFFISLRYLRRIQPEKVISMGGAVSIPVCLAARLLGIPIELYELNARPGKAVRFLARYADVIWLTYHQARADLPSKKCLLTRYPIRFYSAPCRQKAQTDLGLAADQLTILVLGGSQGSIGINMLIKQWIEQTGSLSNVQFIHQTGSFDTTDWVSFYKDHQIPAHVFVYHHDMQSHYSAADIIVCRAGAGTLAEALFFKKHCIIIPLKTDSTDHQYFNAQATAQTYPLLCTTLDQQAAQQNISLFSDAIRTFAQRLNKNL